MEKGYQPLYELFGTGLTVWSPLYRYGPLPEHGQCAWQSAPRMLCAAMAAAAPLLVLSSTATPQGLTCLSWHMDWLHGSKKSTLTPSEWHCCQVASVEAACRAQSHCTRQSADHAPGVLSIHEGVLIPRLLCSGFLTGKYSDGIQAGGSDSRLNADSWKDFSVRFSRNGDQLSHMPLTC